MSQAKIEGLGVGLSGRGLVERELGEGGTATVHLTDDLGHARRDALEVLEPEPAVAVEAERFLAEIETTADPQHPHIVPLFDARYILVQNFTEELRKRVPR